eukprot:ANDGO_02024.mRNA.1 Pre-mRNA-splicing factor 38
MSQGRQPGKEGAVRHVHGTNPMFLIDKVLRERIFESMYWKQHCFALNESRLVDRAEDMQFIAGSYGGFRKPSPFVCLLLKLLQLQPKDEIVLAYLRNPKYKYLTALAAVYIRLVFPPPALFPLLESLLSDCRKLRKRHSSGDFEVVYMDEFADSLIRESSCFEIGLPRLPFRWVLEDVHGIPERQSAILEDFQAEVAARAGVPGAFPVAGATDKSTAIVNSNGDSMTAAPGDRDAKRPRIDASEYHQNRAASNGSHVSFTVEETNRIRLSLGLRPLRL